VRPFLGGLWKRALGLLIQMRDWRYVRFAVVGLSGTVVNLLCLWLLHDYLLAGRIPAPFDLPMALGMAIGLATLNNFYWNRRWTWKDRHHSIRHRWPTQLLRYALASWLGIAAQYGLTLVFAHGLHYLLANALAIFLASVLNFWSNDRWTFRHRPSQPTNPASFAIPSLHAGHMFVVTCLGAMALMAVLGLYLWDLGGDFIPRNGDEMVYAHIAFKTAQQWAHGGAWLPLVSDLAHMRNTKPPLLFWQAMVAGQMGEAWSLFDLRLPSYLYTLLTTLGLVWATRRWATKYAIHAQTGWPSRLSPTGLAYWTGVCFLAFFSTYRYGRPYLTSAPETFYLCLPVLAWLGGWVKSFFSLRNAVWIALSLTGLALYKSFVLVMPVALVWALWGCFCEPRRWKAVWALMTGLGLFAWGVFGLWLLFDPQPQAVWQEFVLGENWGKLGGDGPFHPWWAYLKTALWGSSSVWVQALAWGQNAALIGPLAWIALVYGLWRRYRPAIWSRSSMGVLWGLLIGVMSLFFMLPSQRSARYLIPVMPLLALWLSVNVWALPPRVYRWAWSLSALLSVGLGVVLTSFIQAGMHVAWWTRGEQIAWVIFALAQLALWLGLTLTVWRRGFVLVNQAWHWLLSLLGVCLIWLSVSLALHPLHNASQYLPVPVRDPLKGAILLVPSHFNGDFERYRFLLPTAGLIAPEPAVNPDFSADLEAAHPVVHVLETGPYQAVPACQLPLCRVVHQRWVLRGRHRPEELSWQALWKHPETIWLAREYWMQHRR
jgi:putative flippase GtrA